jgi:NAD(P) transhydrogenase subunit alpha
MVMPTLRIGVLAQTQSGEHRVAVVPEVVGRLRALGAEVAVEAGAGDGAFIPDADYVRAGAAIDAVAEVVDRSDMLLCVTPPDDAVVDRLHDGQVLVGLLGARQNTALMHRLADAGVTAVSLDLLPRTLSRAQAMDALSSQANLAGYKAVLVAAGAYPRFFPMLMTAAGTAKPAQLLVLGAGVAGLQAIGTARRLGALVTGYDVRPEAQADIRSLGARFLDLPDVATHRSESGYARPLSADEQHAQQQALYDRIAGFDVIIATAQVPGRRPPLLVTAEAIASMRPGSIIVDLAASTLGGNVAGSLPGQTTITTNGVTVIGASNLPATVAAAASTAYARNIAALLALFIHEGALRVDLGDEIQAAVVATHDGHVVNPAVASAPAQPVAVGGTP